ncbi:MAG: hypothetical protein KAW91_04975 [candidate division Zixibacteria bacterium]|nr:hypothetical protein [candidate division Zixibacteria bacterium]
MTEADKKDKSLERITDKQRFKYIGFEVFPGKPKEMFKSDAEREKTVEAVRARRAKREALHALREECTLLEERVSFSDRVILGVACLAMIVSLFTPWYSAYNEIEETAQAAEPAEEVVSDSSLVSDSAAFAMGEGDSLGAALAVSPDMSQPSETDTTSPTTEEPTAEELGSDPYAQVSTEEVIHGYVAKKRTHKEYKRLSGIGSFAALGSVGSLVFSSGVVLVLTGVLFLAMTLVCLVVPLYTLYGLFGLKGNPDSRALRLKQLLRLNWLPLGLFLAGVMLSFIGAEYSFDPAVYFTSIGESYGPGALLDTLSWGVYISIGASIMLAVKGVEI